MFRQVPVLPVVVPLALVTVAVLVGVLHRRGRLTVPRALVAVAVAVYLAGIVANTVFPIFLDKPVPDVPWSAHLALLPFQQYELSDALMNVAVFVPVGLLVPLFARRGAWIRSVLVATGLSLAIEVVQYVTAHLLGGGHIADVNDLLSNVLGGLVGVALLALVVRVPALGRVVDRFRWDADPAPHAAAPVPVAADPEAAAPEAADPEAADLDAAAPRA